MLGNAYQVARLARWQRLKRRSFELVPPIAFDRRICATRLYVRKAGSANDKALSEASQDSGLGAFGPRRAEWDDYEVAKAIAKPRSRRAAGAEAEEGRNGLPSLLRRSRSSSSRSAVQDPLQENEAGPSGSSGKGSHRVASVKGKEKAVDPPSSVSQPTDLLDRSSGAAEDITSPDPTGVRRNPVGVQLLSPSLHAQMFPGDPLPGPPESLLKISRDHLAANGLSPEGAAVLPEISFDMPALHGSNIREHFHHLGRSCAEPYLTMARSYAELDLPPMPEQWEVSMPGWTKYGPDGSVEHVADLGDERVVTFDVETLYKLSKYPVMATAASQTAWYSWLSPSIFDDPLRPLSEHDNDDAIMPPPKPWETRRELQHPHELIPLFGSGGSEGRQGPRIVIGHNVGYDRARIKEEYSLAGTETRFLDTLSLHVATRGITSVQRPIWMKHKKAKAEQQAKNEETLALLNEDASERGDASMLESLATLGESIAGDFEALSKRWEDVTSINSLAEVAALHLGRKVDKSVRDRFGADSIKHASQIRPQLQELLSYCAGDVATTQEVYRKVLPLFLESCPHPASFAGVLTMGSAFLPVNESWKQYLHDAETKYRELEGNVRRALRILANKTRREGPQAGDPWASQMDWSPKPARWADEPDQADEATETATSVGPESPSPSGSSTSSQADSTALTDAEVEVSESPPPSSPSRTTPDLTTSETEKAQSPRPSWYAEMVDKPDVVASLKWQNRTLPLLLRMEYKSHPVQLVPKHGWCFAVPASQAEQYAEAHGPPVETALKGDTVYIPISRVGQPRRTKLSGTVVSKDVASGDLSSPYPQLLKKLVNTKAQDLSEAITSCADDLLVLGRDSHWGRQLNWRAVRTAPPTAANDTGFVSTPKPAATKAKAASKKPSFGTWPKWYWELTTPAGSFDLTTRKTVAPLLLRLQWQGFPLVYSKEFKWLFRVPRAALAADEKARGASRGHPVQFSGTKQGDEDLANDQDHLYFRLPHHEGEGKNVGNPLSKSFVKAIESGELASATAEGREVDPVAKQAASDATHLNVLCSYWISSRERIMDQFVVYDEPDAPTSGMILPQVISMGTVTRRAVEATWLTASNAKKNRVGSELKSMVRAPPGYALVGADVDSEELWISSVMGDSQFGMHGATAIGWMTLEGTKSAGTDLHSKTAKILGISRDGAKVFNYSRIYGAGQKHAVQLLMQGDSTLSKEKAEKLAKDLYKATKGSKQVRSRKLAPAAVPYLWHGGSESYLFNTLEAIALSNRPTTPALGCGVTKALSKSYLEEGTAYLPSRINWVVQSSGVDYLHLLITSMDYLIQKYNISARYLISVHDEVRYLSREEDRYRTALALQIANAWTRALFCYNLGLGDMPQGIAFFSAVDVDHVLRKEVHMACETPSHPRSIPPGESLDIMQVLEKTEGGRLGQGSADVMRLSASPDNVVLDSTEPPVKIVKDLTDQGHKRYLDIQASAVGRRSKQWLDDQAPLEGYADTSLRDMAAEKRKNSQDAKAMLRDWEEQSARLDRLKTETQFEWDYAYPPKKAKAKAAKGEILAASARS